jgi:hypothetical protein
MDNEKSKTRREIIERLFNMKPSEQLVRLEPDEVIINKDLIPNLSELFSKINEEIQLKQSVNIQKLIDDCNSQTSNSGKSIGESLKSVKEQVESKDNK